MVCPCVHWVAVIMVVFLTVIGAAVLLVLVHILVVIIVVGHVAVVIAVVVIMWREGGNRYRVKQSTGLPNNNDIMAIFIIWTLVPTTG